MEQKKQELKIELTPEVASGHYSNFTVISHGPTEFFFDFITVAPNMPQAKVQCRVIMTPEYAKNLLRALSENVKRYESTFGEIKRTVPRQEPGGDIPNPFFNGGGKLN